LNNIHDKKESIISILEHNNLSNFDSRALSKQGKLLKSISLHPNSQSVAKNPKEAAKMIAIHEIYKIKGIQEVIELQ
jgi:hypothetical protein